ncbi:DUF1302 family protein [Duganella sp. FT92W]|uniref:DUF1302 family protein n=1 Tax=Pseudoduganella rivuli TaxID=2666085 RepID=A0A7X2LS57_9BURK|nr:DUF1302 domain-containing protein [Pseudoduganella rivuli]MRV70454.1 DUF1302 family protein [Pseudoduganella rivuli]
MHQLPFPVTRTAHTRGTRLPALPALAALLVPLVAAPPALAAEFDTGNPELRVRWDNTLKYSAAARLSRPSAVLVGGANANLDDGDRNFGKGLISNRVDLLSELDITFHNLGGRVSAAAWYDDVYHRATDNGNAATYNPMSVPAGRFTQATRELHGRKAELLDAFVFGKGELGDMSASFRAGRHALLWGESLFFGDNGIAGAQAPVDLIKLLSVPNSQFKELIRPTSQVSGQLQLTPNLSAGAYYQFDWEENRIPAAGSYFSRTDVFDRGGERLLAGFAPGVGALTFVRAHDLHARSSGQGGLQLRWRPAGSDYDLGLYAVRFHSRNFVVEVSPDGGFPALGSYRLIYPEGIRAFGASASKSIDDTNLAAEISVRRNTPLVAAGGSVMVHPGERSDNDDHPLYPVGNSLHAQVSAIHTLSRSAVWDGGLLMFEGAWNRRTSITRNAAALDPNSTRDALGMRAIFSPMWFQAASGLDLSLPVGLGYNPYGRSSVTTLFNGGATKGGDLSIGVSGDYLQTWKGSVTYVRFFGRAGTVLTATNAFSFQQSLKDRDFVSFSLSRTF